MLSVKDYPVDGKRVIVRADFDVPLRNGKITEKLRIEKSIPNLKYLLEKKCKLFIISHLGRPENKDPKYSLKIVLPILEELLGEKIEFQENLERQVFGEVVLLENLRYWKEEESNDLAFSKKLATFGEIYVNECFSVAHRNHASVATLPTLLPAAAGIELFQEINELEKIFKAEKHPLVVIIGGAKLETKLPAITNMAKVADKVLVGGKLMFEIDKSTLPSNVVIAVDDVDQKDIGPETLKTFGAEIVKAQMIVWNGPMGMFEEEKYEVGTRALAKLVADAAGYSIVGGGDTVAALDKEGLLDKIDFVSVGGGAMLEFLEGKKLPALVALDYYD